MITNDHIGVKVRGCGEPQKWRVLSRVEVDTTRRSHLRSIFAPNVTNSSQFDGQAFWPVVWRFTAGWVLVHSHHWHLKTTWALEHVRQAQETSPRKSRPGKQWQWYTRGLLVHWCRNWMVVKSQLCYCVCGSRLLSNPVTYACTYVHICTLGKLLPLSCAAKMKKYIALLSIIRSKMRQTHTYVCIRLYVYFSALQYTQPNYIQAHYLQAHNH